MRCTLTDEHGRPRLLIGVAAEIADMLATIAKDINDWPIGAVEFRWGADGLVAEPSRKIRRPRAGSQPVIAKALQKA